MADDQIAVKQIDQATISAPSALSEGSHRTDHAIVGRILSGAVVLPTMSAGATDGSYLRNAGIPDLRHSGLANDIGESRAHGRDERVLVKSFFAGNEYLYRLVKLLAGGQ